MDRCFVIQPFDGGAFDKRFDDVLAPTIRQADLDPYRVDRDSSVTVPIAAIEKGIRDAAACVADISTDNPNVWFELGYALACRKPVVLVCSSLRTSRFPFDVQHRHIIRYNTDSTSDFDALASDLTARLKAALAIEDQVQSLSQATLRETEGLEPHEIAALIIIAESDLDPESFPSAFGLRHSMDRAGYTEIATVLAVNSLRAKRFVRGIEVQPNSGDGYIGYCLMEEGRLWLMANRGRLALTKPARRRLVVAPTKEFEDFPGSLDDNDLPF